MYNNEKKRSVQVALAFVVLLSGVCFGSATQAPSVTDKVSLPTMVKPFGLNLGVDPTKLIQSVPTTLTEVILPEDISEDGDVSVAYRIVSKSIRDELKAGRPSYALKLLEADPMAKKLKNVEFDRIKAVIAQSYLSEGKIDRAAQVAEQAVKRSGQSVPLAGWVAGQAAWRMSQYGRAEAMFGVAAQSKQSSVWLVSGGAYWAARSAMRVGKTDAAQSWHKIAAQYPRTFYGLISLRALGHSYDFNWQTPELDHAAKKDIPLDLKVAAALRLSREGKLSAAVTTLGSSRWMNSDVGRRSLLAFFMMKKDPALTLYMARKTRDENGRFYDVALYPESPWEPKAGYEVDKALIHALIRQESRFNPFAVSSVGAQGLMQIMPATAQYVSANVTEPLSHPETNLGVGQKYVKQLLRDPSVNNDLFKMAVAYNAGPGNLARWQNDLKDMDDPMLFIESIPSGETRAFVERVMVNYWIYRQRMGLDVPSLDAVAALDAPSLIETAAIGKVKVSDQVAMADLSN